MCSKTYSEDVGIKYSTTEAPNRFVVNIKGVAVGEAHSGNRDIRISRDLHTNA